MIERHLLESAGRIEAAEVYPHALDPHRYNEAHRAIRRSIERGGEVVAVPGGFTWFDDSWFAEVSVSVITEQDNTAVTAFVRRRRESLGCIFGTPPGFALAALFGTAQIGLFGLAAEAAVVAFVLGIPTGFLLDRWTKNRWRRRVWAAVEDLRALLTD